MDGVCDSQASVAEAKELIANIDEVLDVVILTDLKICSGLS
jgi:hypothetical protein